MPFIYTGISGLSVLFRVRKLPWRGTMVGSFVVSHLGVEATPKREFTAVLISQKFLHLVRWGKQWEGVFPHLLIVICPPLKIILLPKRHILG